MEARMTDKFEIPESMRDFAEKSMEHARKAFEDYAATAQKAVGKAESTAADAQENARAFGEKAISFAEENMAASFDYAKSMVNAKTIEDMVKIQSDFVERQIATFTQQSQDLTNAMTAKAKNAKGGEKAGE
jgi:phasin